MPEDKTELDVKKTNPMAQTFWRQLGKKVQTEKIAVLSKMKHQDHIRYERYMHAPQKYKDFIENVIAKTWDMIRNEESEGLEKWLNKKTDAEGKQVWTMVNEDEPKGCCSGKTKPKLLLVNSHDTNDLVRTSQQIEDLMNADGRDNSYDEYFEKVDLSKLAQKQEEENEEGGEVEEEL